VAAAAATAAAAVPGCSCANLRLTSARRAMDMVYKLSFFSEDDSFFF